MTPSDGIIHTSQFGGVYFDLKNQYKILLNIVKKKYIMYRGSQVYLYTRMKN